MLQIYLYNLYNLYIYIYIDAYLYIYLYNLYTHRPFLLGTPFQLIGNTNC